jgi:predicted nucleic-acid-binding protein
MLNITFFITRSAIKEVVWVLTKINTRSAVQVALTAEALLSSDQIVIENEFAENRAVMCYTQGTDFAAALHLASLGKASALATFD